jgi:hypothetical protein
LHTSNMSQPASQAAVQRATMSPATLAPAIDRSSLKMTPSKPSSSRSSRIQTGEKPAGRRIHLRIDDVRRHDAVELEAAVGRRGQAPFRLADARRPAGDVRIRLDPAVAGEVLATGGHAGAAQAFDQRAASSTTRPDRVEGTIADDAAAAPVEIEHRREGQIDAAGAQLGGEQVTSSAAASHAAACGHCPTVRRDGASAAGG